jgi:alpha-glucoside transport system substrate-binding protein
LAGTTITLSGHSDMSPPLQQLIDRFEEATGIQVLYRNLDPRVPLSDLGPDRADLVLLPAVQHRQSAAAGELIDLGTYVEPAEARAVWGDFLFETGAVDDGYFGVPFRTTTKGLVWYPPDAFAAAGYTIPTTWDELLDLGARMVADGRTPWCMGLDGEEFGGWPATDWLEGLVLRVGGVELYDQWMAHDIPFDDPGIVQAAQLFGDLVFDEALVGGTSQAAIRSSYFTAGVPMLEDPPGCWLTYGTSFQPDFMPAAVGVGYDFFVLPPLEAGDPAPLFGDVELLAATADRPEVRELVRRMLDPEDGPAWASSGGYPFLPAHPGAIGEQCEVSGGGVDRRTNEVWADLCAATTAAVAAGEFRLDASDLMPSEIGRPGDGLGNPEVGAFLDAMEAYLDGGPSTLADALASVEAAWPS